MKGYISFCILICSIALLPIEGMAGQTYYVSPQGSDGNAGTLQAPWQSLRYAITVVAAGDTIVMRGGTHIANEVWIRGDRGMGGAKGQYLTIKNYPGEVPSLGGERRLIVDGAEYVRVEGLHFQLPYRLAGGGVGFQVINNTFKGPQPRYGAIEFYGDDGLVEGNTIEISGGGDTKDHGIYLHAGHNNIIRNNVIKGFSGYGIHAYDATASGGGDAARGYENILIENNVITSSQYRAGIIVFPDRGLEAKNIRIFKNIISGNALNGIRLRGYSHDIEIFNNTIFGNGAGADGEDDVSAISVRDGSVYKVAIKNNIIELDNSDAYHIQNREGAPGITAENNLYWHAGKARLFKVSEANARYADPLFVAPANGDFHLKASSPAIDKGVKVGLPFLKAAPDLGALEYGEPAKSANREHK